MFQTTKVYKHWYGPYNPADYTPMANPGLWSRFLGVKQSRTPFMARKDILFLCNKAQYPEVQIILGNLRSADELRKAMQQLRELHEQSPAGSTATYFIYQGEEVPVIPIEDHNKSLTPHKRATKRAPKSPPKSLPIKHSSGLTSKQALRRALQLENVIKPFPAATHSNRNLFQFATLEHVIEAWNRLPSKSVEIPLSLGGLPRPDGSHEGNYTTQEPVRQSGLVSRRSSEIHVHFPKTLKGAGTGRSSALTHLETLQRLMEGAFDKELIDPVKQLEATLLNANMDSILSQPLEVTTIYEAALRVHGRNDRYIDSSSPSKLIEALSVNYMEQFHVTADKAGLFRDVELIGAIIYIDAMFPNAQPQFINDRPTGYAALSYKDMTKLLLKACEVHQLPVYYSPFCGVYYKGDCVYSNYRSILFPRALVYLMLLPTLYSNQQTVGIPWGIKNYLLGMIDLDALKILGSITRENEYNPANYPSCLEHLDLAIGDEMTKLGKLENYAKACGMKLGGWFFS